MPGALHCTTAADMWAGLTCHTGMGEQDSPVIREWVGDRVSRKNSVRPRSKVSGKDDTPCIGEVCEV